MRGASGQPHLHAQTRHRATRWAVDDAGVGVRTGNSYSPRGTCSPESAFSTLRDATVAAAGGHGMQVAHHGRRHDPQPPNLQRLRISFCYP